MTPTTAEKREQKRAIVATLDDIRAMRTVTAPGPSGLEYTIRPLNMERYALAGGLPASLREIALKGAEGVQEILTGSTDVLDERGPEIISYLDGLVRQVVVEPDLTDVALDELPPVDYRWLVAVAMGEMVHDGEGKRLFGREPVTSWSSFREFHGCAPDCPECLRMVDTLSAVTAK